ncbi:MAG: nuclear transport factor 2 family protein [Luminiphilus sp.]|jgi:3-phenylpropionate/cinnamic acid dioxygenase small subunit|nr:nuclear transport factor 2 family protein [Luminiphilus sp.]
MPSAEDRFAISEVLNRMAYYYDEGHLDDLATCFADEAIMSMQIAGGDIVGPFEGRDNIMELYRGAKSTQTDVRRHDITNIMFDTSGDILGVTSYLTLFATEHAETKLLTTGVYRDQVALIDGKWKITRRHIDLDSAY